MNELTGKVVEVLRGEWERIYVVSYTGKMKGCIYFCRDSHVQDPENPDGIRDDYKVGDKVIIEEWFLTLPAKEVKKLANL